MKKWKKCQQVDIGSSEELCKNCNTNLTDISNFIYNGENHSEPDFWQELCKCKKCGTLFVIQYNIFDSGGHIYQRVFAEDMNDTSHSWQEELTDEQKLRVGKHLEGCKICRDRLSDEQLAGAWVKDMFDGLKEKIQRKGE